MRRHVIHCCTDANDATTIHCGDGGVCRRKGGRARLSRMCRGLFEVVVFAGLMLVVVPSVSNSVALQAAESAETPFLFSVRMRLSLDDTAVDQAVNQSLNRSARFEWYKDGEMRPVRLDAEPNLPQPQYEWQWDWDWNQRNSNANNTPVGGDPTAPGSIDWLSEAMRAFIWILLAVTLALLIYFWLTRAARQQMSNGDGRDSERIPRREVDLIEQLPFQVTAPKSDLLAEARRHFEAGNYNEAIVYLYSHQLIQLDQHAMIRLNKGKTNRQYLLELRRATSLRDILSRTVLAFEDAFFGRHELDAQRFGACWSDLELFAAILADSPTTNS